jgi:predicted O-linked N-acetylglucosamine transferase (SPINDLY family)
VEQPGQAVYARAVQAHREGRLADAERLYRQLLALEPNHPEALHQLGVLAMRAGRVADGVELLKRASSASPAEPQVLLHLAQALAQAHRLAEAIAAFDRLIGLQPDFALAWLARADALLKLKEPRAALESYDRLLELAPAHAAALCNRANALQDLDRLGEALEGYERALALQPELIGAHNNRGNVLRKLGRHKDALASYEHALRLDPHLATAHNNRGLALMGLARPEEALAAFERALEEDPSYLDALINRGNCLRDLRRPEAALASYEQALALDPACPEALTNRGNALLDLARHQEALESYDRALELLPDVADLLANRARLLLELSQFDAAAHCLERLLHVAPTYEDAHGNLLHCQLHVCAWERYTEQVARLLAALEQSQRVIHPFAALAITASASLQRRAAELLAARFEPPTLAHRPARARAGRKLKVAYVSADLREHAVSYLMAAVFEEHDRRQLETTAISLTPKEPTAMGARVSAAFDRFVDVSRRSDAEVAALVRDLEVDIAVDLMGYTHKARPGIFARRAAPIQVSYLGYPGTSGARCIDYILADDFVIPLAARPHYSEQVVYLPGCFQANDSRCVIGPVPAREAVGLPPAGLVLCSFNASYKLNPPVFDVWMRLLREAPGSVLWLLGDREDTRSNLCARALAHGVDPHRLVFAPRVPYPQHLGRLALADLFLDTLPYNAGTTASDALRRGVPVLTCVGEALASRMAGSLLRALKMPCLITSSLEEYERRGLELVAHSEQLAEARSKLAAHLGCSHLFDSARFCRHLEAAYLAMHERAARGEPPASFALT